MLIQLDMETVLSRFPMVYLIWIASGKHFMASLPHPQASGAQRMGTQGSA